MIISGGHTPHYRRLMVFIDGSNFLMEISRHYPASFRQDNPPAEAIKVAKWLIGQACSRPGIMVIRKFWFSSYKGSEETHLNLAKTLRSNGFEPILFRKRSGREKGVDIALAKEMLINSFNQNFDAAILVAGDEDYIGLVNDIKRYGPVVWGAFFREGLAENLEIAFDEFIDLAAIEKILLNHAAFKELISSITVSKQTDDDKVGSSQKL